MSKDFFGAKLQKFACSTPKPNQPRCLHNRLMQKFKNANAKAEANARANIKSCDYLIKVVMRVWQRRSAAKCLK